MLVRMVLPGDAVEVVHGVRGPYWEYGHVGRMLLASERNGRKKRHMQVCGSGIGIVEAANSVTTGQFLTLLRFFADRLVHRTADADAQLTLLLDTLPQLRAALAPRSRIPDIVPGGSDGRDE